MEQAYYVNSFDTRNPDQGWENAPYDKAVYHSLKDAVTAAKQYMKIEEDYLLETSGVSTPVIDFRVDSFVLI